MSETRVWFGDQHPVSWDATSDGVPIDFTGADVVLHVDPVGGGTPGLDLPVTTSPGVVTHQLDGTLPVGPYDGVVRATIDGKTVTYPDAESGPMRLVVKARLE